MTHPAPLQPDALTRLNRDATRRDAPASSFNWIMAGAFLFCGFAWGTVIFAICEVIR